jgi:excisionase family DNA binding protein
MDETEGTEQVPYTRVTVAEAAAALGVSVVTIRRMIKRGQLEGERVIRPQGSAYLVRLPVDGTDDATPTEQPVQDMSRTQGTGTTPTGQAEALATLVQATLTPIIAPLVAELAATRQASERKDAELRDLEREIGRVTALLDSARGEIRALTARPRTEMPATPPEQASWAWLRRRWVWVAVLVAFVLGIVALLVWPR